jgi:hypothetical protein
MSLNRTTGDQPNINTPHAEGGTGCSSSCTLENNYFSCWTVGEKCKPDCNFIASEMLNYYLEDPTCGEGDRDTSIRKRCGSSCPGRETLSQNCTHQNRGCLACDGVTEYADGDTRQCIPCGFNCPVGYYPSSCSPVKDNSYPTTLEQKGCHRCLYDGTFFSLQYTERGAYIRPRGGSR